jgi:DNA ligase D-like protein (predicted ligase)
MKPLYLPMLAQKSQPFDHADYEFEVKWDGVRALASVEPSGWRLWGRSGTDYTARYPELAVLQSLPAGTVLDGELVVLRQGRADFPTLLGRHQRCRPVLQLWASQELAVSYMLFDMLVERGRSLLQEPLRQRRARLRDLLTGVTAPLLYSDGVAGQGRDFFAQAVAQGHEGVIAKHLGGRYQPGKRARAWRKIKPVGVLPCVLIGYTAGWHEVHSVLLATLREGRLVYVGRLRRGLSAEVRALLARRLLKLRRDQPVVPCAERATWLEPEVYCRVSYQGWTCHGHLRHAVFGGWLAEPGQRQQSSEFLTELT